MFEPFFSAGLVRPAKRVIGFVGVTMRDAIGGGADREVEGHPPSSVMLARVGLAV